MKAVAVMQQKLVHVITLPIFTLQRRLTGTMFISREFVELT
jgi:hypothetical protein